MGHYHHRRRSFLSGRNWLFAGFCVLALVTLGFLLYVGEQEEAERRAYYEAVDQRNLEEQRALEKDRQEAEAAEALHVAEIKARIPGVVCWGDSLTAGAGGNGTTYPKVIS